MKYSEPKITEVSLETKGIEHDNGADGPSKCSNSCCYYRDGAAW